MKCPVCDNDKISPFATHCLNCGADVVAFPLLEDLEEQAVVTLKENVSLQGELTTLAQLRKHDKKGFQKRMGRMYWFLFLFPLMFFWCGKKNIPVEGQKKTEELETRNMLLENDVVLLQKQIDSLSVLLEHNGIPEKVTHIVNKGESLYLLAEKYLQDGTKWKSLGALNPEIKDYKRLMPGDTIVIKLR